MKIWPPDKTTAKVWIISYLVLTISVTLFLVICLPCAIY